MNKGSNLEPQKKMRSMLETKNPANFGFRVWDKGSGVCGFRGLGLKVWGKALRELPKQDLV